MTPDRRTAYLKDREIRKRYRTDPRERDDYYKQPKDTHHAIHESLIFGKLDPKRIEVQIQSKKMARLDSRMHNIYKANKPLSPFIKIGKKLFKQGY